MERVGVVAEWTVRVGETEFPLGTKTASEARELAAEWLRESAESHGFSEASCELVGPVVATLTLEACGCVLAKWHTAW